MTCNCGLPVDYTMDQAKAFNQAPWYDNPRGYLSEGSNIVRVNPTDWTAILNDYSKPMSRPAPLVKIKSGELAIGGTPVINYI
jgi:hypothetical protein